MNVVVETDKKDDPTRPLYDRPKGEVGIYLDVYDAESLSPKDYGSRRFLLLSLMDRLYEHLLNLPLDIIKGGFERENVLEGVIFQKFYQGIILSVGFESIDAHDGFWSHFKAGKLEKQMQNILVTSALKKKLNVKSLQIRTRLFKDEETDCRNEIEDGDTVKTLLKDPGHHIDMINKVRHFQKTELSDITASCKDGLRILDDNLSHMLMVLKRNIGNDTEAINSYKELLRFIKLIRDRKNLEMSSLIHYTQLHDLLDKNLSIMEEMICHPLAQIPSSCETAKQSEIKVSMADKCRTGRLMLKADYNLSTTRHMEWLIKILSKERDLFGGIVSVLAICTDCAVDTDQLLDEYLSAFPLDF